MHCWMIYSWIKTGKDFSDLLPIFIAKLSIVIKWRTAINLIATSCIERALQLLKVQNRAKWRYQFEVNINYIVFQPFSKTKQFQKQSSELFWKKGVLKNFANFTWKHLWWSLFNNVAGLQDCNFIKKRFLYRCFLITVLKVLRAPILKNMYGRLLLQFQNFKLC